MSFINQVILGDCANVLKDFLEESIDCIVTDPPYGLNFMGKQWDKALPPKAAFMEMYRVLKPGALAFIMSSPRQDLMWRMAQMLEESGFELGQSFISWVYASGFPKAFDISKGIDKKLGVYVEGEISPNSREGYDAEKGSFSHAKKITIDEPQHELAKQWSGWKSVTGLKPALEVIFMVQKPLTEKTIVDNVLKWGTGAMNVDACRIPIESNDLVQSQSGHKGEPFGIRNREFTPREYQTEGRFPANLLVSDDTLNDGKERPEAGNKTETYNAQRSTGELAYGKNLGGYTLRNNYGTVDSFSRYFDLDAWAKYHGFLNVPKAGTGEREYGLYLGEKKDYLKEDGSWGSHEIFSNKYTESSGNPSNRGKTPKRRNIHPTVKPIKLGAYLCELGCSRGGIVLDPFCGSGSFLIAAKITGKKYIGIDIDPKSIELSEARLRAYPEPLEASV